MREYFGNDKLRSMPPLLHMVFFFHCLAKVVNEEGLTEDVFE